MSIFCQQKRATAINSKVLGPFKGQAAISRMPVLFRSVNRSQEMTSGIVRQALVKADDLPSKRSSFIALQPENAFPWRRPTFTDEHPRQSVETQIHQDDHFGAKIAWNSWIFGRRFYLTRLAYHPFVRKLSNAIFFYKRLTTNHSSITILLKDS